jgi:predicted nucleic acid-binding protein
VAQLIAIYDACVLYPAPLRDFLMQLALTDLFRAKWTHRIHDEWIRNLMNSATRDGLVEGYDALIDSVKLPDEDDRHVLAAAIHTHANLIVTFNLKDFPAKVLHSHKIEAIHPDDFVMRLIKMDSVSVCEAARAHRARLRNPPKSVDEYLSTLSEQRLIKGVEYLRTNRGVI